MQRVSRPPITLPTLANVIQPVAVLLALAALGMLAMAASGQASTAVDIRITGWVQGLHVPGLDFVSAVVNFVTNAPMAIAFWFAAMSFFVLKGRPLEAIVVFSISGLWIANELVGVIVDRPVPSMQAAGAIEFAREVSGSFPSGHVTGVVAFYGLLTFLTFGNAGRTGTRLAISVITISMIGLVSLSRVYTGAHWPTDVLGSYIIGLVGVSGIAWLYVRVRSDTLRIPRPRGAKRPSTPVNGVTVTGSIASTVYLDWKAGTATKQYSAPLPIRALYWLAFQAPFPYSARRDALEAAASKRRVAGLLTKHKYGYDMVAAVHGIHGTEGSYQFETELINGVEPASNSEVGDLLADLYAYFQETGLPTWQIAPGNPHAYSNFIRKSNGEMKLIDLESALVSVSYPITELRAALRDGNVPTFDDVDFIRLRGYVSDHASELADTIGSQGILDLNEAIESAETHSMTWKSAEPRVWGRAGARIYRTLDLSGIVAGIRRRLDNLEARSTAFLSSAIDRWEQEDRITAVSADCLRNRLGTSEMSAALRHMGAHMALSLAIVVPIPGLRSLARFGWTLTFRIKALYALGRGRISGEEYRTEGAIHSIPVMLLALVPAIGAIAYAGSEPMMKGPGRLLLDQGAAKLPFQLYRRLGLARLTAPDRQNVPHAVPRIAGNPVTVDCE